ncbi:MAG: DUF2243 domain-containing protein [Actinomycetota bacterium]|nr:DUF2243 domain-containing protein [Actinomycetota bacterium]
MIARRLTRAPGLLLGAGLGAFVDGIVLHQLLQWHHVVSHREPTSTVVGLELNTLWDGLFHVLAWVAVVAGVALLSSRVHSIAAAPPPAMLWGWVLAGWGLFNLIEGLINHHLLAVHHVRDDLGGPVGWDLGFLATGVLLLSFGQFTLARTARQVRSYT